MRKITIYDVAGLAGVSIATVSRVINGSHKVRETTFNKVVQAVDELNFVPDENATKLGLLLGKYRKGKA